jgi:hypothetical protein
LCGASGGQFPPRAGQGRCAATLSDDSRTTGTSSWNYGTRETREKAQYIGAFADFSRFSSFLVVGALVSVVSEPFLKEVNAIIAPHKREHGAYARGDMLSTHQGSMQQ